MRSTPTKYPGPPTHIINGMFAAIFSGHMTASTPALSFVQGFLTATLTYIEPGQDLDVFIVQDSDREADCGYDDPTHPFVHSHLEAYGNTQATFHVTQPGWYGFIVDGYNGSAGQYTVNIQWKPIQPPSGTPLPTLVPTETPGATPQLRRSTKPPPLNRQRLHPPHPARPSLHVRLDQRSRRCRQARRRLRLPLCHQPPLP